MSKFDDSPACACPLMAIKGKCGEYETLEVMEQFRRFYENKLHEIDIEGGGDCLELKLKVQQRWIDDLTEQTEMMARIVKELENEATDRVQILEEKLRQTSKAAYEVMKRYQTYNITHNLDEPFQKVFYLENDVKNLLEFVRRIRENGQWTIDGLQFYDISHNDLFGEELDNKEVTDDALSLNKNDKSVISVTNGLESKKKANLSNAEDDEELRKINEAKELDLSEQLKKKTEEYETLKQSMLDMRSALTEEVACKHDVISSLKKDVQQLEERCVQSDKQTAFKDDIIKELRKEIKQLKHQLTKERKEKEEELSDLKCRIVDLEMKLEDAKAQMCCMRPCVDMITRDTMIDDELVIKKSKLIQNKDEIIQIQNDTLNVIQLELQAARKKEMELEDEICRRQCEVEELKCKCQELEKALSNSQGRAENLQKAVDLYLNSINVLEASEERAKIEIEQQKMTIANLQEALVHVKQELDEVRQKNQQEVQNQQYLINIFYVNLLDLEEKNEIYKMEIMKLNESYTKLQNCNFELEIEHFNSLQDLAILETQLHKYQNEYKSFEEYRLGTRGELRKLRQQKRCYEQVVERFKQEMAVMSEQLIHLQEILKLSNQSCKEENGQLYNAVTDLQKLSERLQDQLIETEKKVIIENQMNQMKDAKIDELHLIIGQKNADLNTHDEAIHEMKKRLENSILENHDLQATIVSLNSTIMQLQCSLQAQETEKLQKVETCKSQIHLCKKSICDFQEDLERKSKQLEMLQGDYKAQYELFKAAQFELEQVKEKTKEKLKQMKRQNEVMKEKLVTSEMHNQQLSEELASLREQTTQIAQRECCREQELAQCKQTIIELRQTLIELNESLADSELHNMALVEEFKKSKTENRQQEDIYLSCRCEIMLYKKLAENFKTSLIQARKSLTEAETANKSLKDEIKTKEIKLNEIQKKLLKKDRETCQTVRELTEKLKQSQMEQKRLCEFIENLKNEIKGKGAENTANGYCPCDEIANTQEEINSLKGDIKNMIQNQIALNAENDKLLKQVSCLQSTVNCVEERNRLLKEKLEKTLAENQTLQESNQILLYQRNKLAQSVKNLESELADARNNCDDICAESRHVVNNVKAWLEEQKRINDCVKMKTQCYCNTIQKLKQENENLLGQSQAKSPSPILKNKTAKHATQFRTCSPVCYQNWNLGSQGTGSYDESPRGSPSSFLTCSVEEWYSPNYRDDDETDDREILAEDEFIARLETATLEMKSSNRKLRNKCAECLVSRDKVK